jgi:phospholipid N-methyltransferase
MLIDKMLEPVDWAKCRLFVEYGPGVGTFTQQILERLAPDATLLTIDTNPTSPTISTASSPTPGWWP